VPTSRQTLIASAPRVLAATLSAGALVWPFLWLAVGILVALAGICASGVRIRGVAHGPADLIVIPLRFLGTGLRWLGRRVLTIGPMILATLSICCWGVIAIAVPAAIGGSIWFVSHGLDGLVAAARLTAVDHGIRVFAFIVFYSCLRRVLSRRSVAGFLEVHARTLPEVALTTGAAVGLVWLVLCGLVLPSHTWAPASGLNDLISHLPPGIRHPISGGRAALAEYEARAVVRCMADHGRFGWRAPEATANSDGSVRVVVEASSSGSPGDRSIAVLMLSLENQLAHHVDSITIGRAIQYAPRAVSSPIDDMADVAQNAPNTAVTQAVSRISPSEGDVKVALRCSAVAI